MKIGLYASMFGKDDPPTLQSIESYIEHAYNLRLDLIDFRSDRGFSSSEPDYLIKTKLSCIEKGLSIGYLASGGHFSEIHAYQPCFPARITCGKIMLFDRSVSGSRFTIFPSLR